jgi:hypothetical protein
MDAIAKIELVDDRVPAPSDGPLADDEKAILVTFADGRTLTVPRQAVGWAEWRDRMDEHRP